MKQILLCLLIGLSGCSLFKAPTDLTQAQRIERLSQIAELAAYTGTALRLADHPEDRPKFQAAADSLAAATAGDTTALQRVLSTLPVKELKGDKGAIIIGAAILLYETELKKSTTIDQASLAGSVSKSIRAGIIRALVQIPPK